MNNHLINQSSSAYAAAEMLLLNDQLDVLIYCIYCWDDIADQGLPFDEYDHLYYLDELISHEDEIKKQEDVLRATLFNACRGAVSHCQQSVAI